MEMIIVPLQKVGELEFGMQRQQVRNLLGVDYKATSKGFGELLPHMDEYDACDMFREVDLHIFYNKQNELHFVEMGFHTTPIFEGMNLIQGRMEEKFEQLKKFDGNPQIDKEAYTFLELGIQLYSEREDRKIELVSAFSKEYAEFIRGVTFESIFNQLNELEKKKEKK